MMTFFLYIFILEICLLLCLITHWLVKSCINISMWFISSSMSWHKRSRTNMLSTRTISTSLSRWHLHLSGRKRDYRERIFRKNSMPDGTSRWLRIPFEGKRKYMRKWIQNHTGGLCKTREAIGEMCHRRIRVCRENYVLFLLASPPTFFFSGFRLSLSPSFDLSLVRKDPDTCFHSKHTEEASPCNNTTLNTKGTRPISSFDSYGVSFWHILPSLKASSPLKRNVWKKNYVCAATYIRFDEHRRKKLCCRFV